MQQSMMQQRGGRDCGPWQPSPLLCPQGYGQTEPPAGIPLLPNAITLTGYVLGLWWSAGGPAWSAVASALLDEVDGAVARARNETSEFGSTFDWATDIILTALALQRVKAPFWALPVATVGQVYLRNAGYRPPLGSVRAAVMLWGLLS